MDKVCKGGIECDKDKCECNLELIKNNNTFILCSFAYLILYPFKYSIKANQ